MTTPLRERLEAAKRTRAEQITKFPHAYSKDEQAWAEATLAALPSARPVTARGKRLRKGAQKS